MMSACTDATFGLAAIADAAYISCVLNRDRRPNVR